MLELTLPDMSCGHCVKTITRVVQQLDAGARLDFDLPAHKVRIESSQPENRLREALAEEGYPAAG